MANNKNSSTKDCSTCRGKGQLKCPICKGKGRPFDCSHCGDIAEVDGWGVVTCGRCKADGKMNRT